MRKLIIIIGLILPLATSAQFRVGVNVGYGSYDQKDLTKFMIWMRNDLPVDGKIVESFPPYFTGSIYGYHIVGQLHWGVSITWGATAARLSYNDFSGSITRDMLVSYGSFGIPVGWTLNPEARWKITLEATPYYNLTFAEYRNETIILDEKDSYSEQMSTLNFAIQPAIFVSREVGRFGFHLKGGYNLTWLKGNLTTNVSPFYNYNDDISIDWNGYRIDAGVSIFLGKMRTTSEEVVN